MSLTPALYNVTMYENVDWSQPYTLPPELGDDFTGYAVLVSVKANYDDAEAVLVLDADVEPEGTFTLTVDASEVPAADTYRWAATLTNGPASYPLWYGDLTVQEWATP